MNKDQKLNFLGIFLFFSLIIAFFFSEDLLGGAQHDFEFHKKFVILFSELNIVLLITLLVAVMFILA